MKTSMYNSIKIFINLIKIRLFIFAALIIIPQYNIACTAFILKRGDSHVVGRNYDYRSSQGVIMINPKNLFKTSIPFPGEKSAQWVAKFGSITFNALGREQPIEGINEAGLVVVGLSLEDKPQYPEPDERPVVDMLQWIQYVLDNYASVKEVIEKVDKIRISNQSIEVCHYLVSDAKGNFAIVEYIKGQLICYYNDYATSGFICNDYFKKSCTDVSKYTFKGGSLPTISTFEKYNSEEAVVIGASTIDSYISQQMAPYAFMVLEKVNAPLSTPFYKNYGTQWSVVYDSKNKKLTFTTLHNKEVREIDLQKLDFKNFNDIKALSITESTNTDIYKQFRTFTVADNLNLMNSGVCIYLGMDKLPEYLEKEVEMAASYPYHYICSTTKPN